jgi:uncharacterized protein YhfF
MFALQGGLIVNLTIDEYFNLFLKDSGRSAKDTSFAGEITFGLDEEECNWFIQRVLSGEKKANTCSLESMELDLEPIPKKGEFSVLTDYYGKPVAVLETLDVQIIGFNNISWEMAQKAGNANSMEEWREAEIQYLEEDGELMGYEFSSSMPIVFEEFKVVYSK